MQRPTKVSEKHETSEHENSTSDFQTVPKSDIYDRMTQHIKVPLTRRALEYDSKDIRLVGLRLTHLVSTKDAPRQTAMRYGLLERINVNDFDSDERKYDEYERRLNNRVQQSMDGHAMWDTLGFCRNAVFDDWFLISTNCYRCLSFSLDPVAFSL